MKLLITAFVFGIAYLSLYFGDFILGLAITKGARSLIYAVLAAIIAAIAFFITERIEKKIRPNTTESANTPPFITAPKPKLFLFVFLLLLFLPFPQLFCLDGCELTSLPLFFSLTPFILIPIVLVQFLGNAFVLFSVLYLVAKKFRNVHFMPEFLFTIVAIAWIFFAPIFYERWVFILLGIIWSAFTIMLASRFSNMPQQGIPFLRLRKKI